MQADLVVPSPFEAPSLRRLALASLAVVLLGFGGLLGWAAIARLESAVPAAGSLVAQGKRKTVSLLDSGILRELRVREGAPVAAGEVLLLLDDSQARALVEQSLIRIVSAEARSIRLRAEMEEAPALLFPEGLQRLAPPAIAAPLLAAERTLFASRRESYEGSVAVQRRRIAQLHQQIAASRAQIQATGTRLALLRQELAGVRDLLANGYATRLRHMELQRAIAEQEGNVGELEARAAEAAQAVAQAELELLNLASTRRNEAALDMQAAVTELADARARLSAAEELLRRSVVTAPEDGVVTDLRFFTPGSSITAGQPVLDIVPAQDALLVEAAVSPAEIERVAVGQRVNVRLTAFPHRKVPPLPGQLVYVGADRQVNPQGQPFFLVRARLEDGALRDLPPEVALSPGMPADVLILGRARSPLDYFVSPLLDGMRKALREE
ncbi:HlyD family type I secretion periplasmic adaptor subunit [Paracraurococcus ruber]|uniref:Membrane fusion protein (MFP) family protein n=1 Tax=Paracraurococcus ruber TaxID=77675 RepID=A0ABS1D8C8_9PROT|nr:HlyD family type I secretion periplasmic adaptor subunit [Paracraurococcus ruber]MBK1662312.1 hypothetical protein [Paracraurococcus ruber]TDG11457.1 HlyD family type I secretion periplasmic adaptor subunit [Paracraurococcus ruber]